MRVLVVGAGLMGAQIGVEYALGGHEVTLVARDAAAARRRAENGLATARSAGQPPADVESAAERIDAADDVERECDLAVESLPEELALKASLLRRVPGEPLLCSNTSSLSITALGEAAGAPERVVGTHYWNPPLLMPLVEVTRGEQTAPAVVQMVADTLRALGKRPIVLEREVPGFLWNRLQFALLRECVALVDAGVASPEALDEVIRDGLARRYRHVGLFQAIALGGPETWRRSAANVLPTLSNANELADLARYARDDDLAAVSAARDRGLVQELISERSTK